MEGKFILYGGAGGIGSAIGRVLCREGASVHLVGRNEARLAAVAEELNAGYTVGDVVDSELFPRVMKDAGDGIAGLVYAAGTLNLRSFQRLEPADYLRDFQINALGAAMAVQAALKPLKAAKPGAVLLFSSVAAGKGFPFHASIGMAKAAVSGLTLALAAELAPHVRVNAIAPSLTHTPLAESILANEKTAEAMAALHPLKRLGCPDDISTLAAFLLSPQAGWITGQVIGIDGGRATLNC